MSDTLVQSRREKICLHLLENGGESSMAALGEWCALKLLVSHQPLSELLEGMVEDGLLRWDGTSFSLHSEGRALGEQAKAAGPSKRKKKAGADPAAGEPAAPSPVTPLPAESAVAATPEPDAPKPDAPTPAADPGQGGGGHDHGHSHGHGHSHERAGAGEEEDLPPPPRRSPPSGASSRPRGADAPAAEKKRGIFARIKCRLKKLLGR